MAASAAQRNQIAISTMCAVKKHKFRVKHSVPRVVLASLANPTMIVLEMENAVDQESVWTQQAVSLNVNRTLNAISEITAARKEAFGSGKIVVVQPVLAKSVVQVMIVGPLMNVVMGLEYVPSHVRSKTTRKKTTKRKATKSQTTLPGLFLL